MSGSAREGDSRGIFCLVVGFELFLGLKCQHCSLRGKKKGNKFAYGKKYSAVGHA